MNEHFIDNIDELNDNQDLKEPLEPFKSFQANFNYWLGKYLAYKLYTLTSKNNANIDKKSYEKRLLISSIENKKNIVKELIKNGLAGIKAYYYAIIYFYDFLVELKAKSLLQIGNKAIEYWLKYYTELWSNSTKKNRLAILLDFFNFIKENSYSNKKSDYFNFDYKLLSKNIENENKVIEAITNGEFIRFVEFVREFKKSKKRKKLIFDDARARLLVLFLIYGGYRSEELINIKLKDIEIVEDEYFKIKITGKGNKERITYIKYENIIKEYEEYLELRASLNCKSDYLFITKNCKKMHYQGVYKTVEQLLRKSGIKTQKRGGHILRHSYAVYLLNNGFNINEVMQLLGHNSITTTQKYLAISNIDIEKKYKKDKK